jgi:hypothetical protein
LAALSNNHHRQVDFVILIRRFLRPAGFVAAALLSLPVVAAWAQSQPAPVKPAPTPQVLAFDKFMKQSSPICQKQASHRCVDAGWRYADRNGDKTLDLAELQTVRAEMGDWLAWKEGITQREKANVAMGLWVVDSAGLPNLFASYDANGDGKLTQAELLADVKLDQRPLGQVLTDEKAVNRQRFSQRLGPLSKLAEALMQPRPAPGNTPAPRAPVQSQPVPPR